jgi:hypothetical protein
MSDWRQIAWVLVSHLFLFFAIGEANTFLAGARIHLSLDLLLLVFPGLFLPIYPGAFIVLIMALLSGTAHPLPISVHYIGYLLTWLILVWSRTRIRIGNNWQIRTVSILLQLLWMSVLTVYVIWPNLPQFAIPGRLLMDAVCSLLVLLILAPLWCAGQKYLLLLLGWNMESNPLRS